jgi:predicted glycoside hydrolase/deacetylase ChbG (UPF0249 family)
LNLPDVKSDTRLVITGDDFGLNSQVNEAVEEAFQAGWLQQTSLMITGPALDEAVRIARRNPSLTVGLHLTLCDGFAVHRSQITNRNRKFSPGDPAWAGLRYFADRLCRADLAKEIAEQFGLFNLHGFPSIYWDGHCHLHMHPLILDLTLSVADRFRFTRVVYEPSPSTFRGATFNMLSRMAIPKLKAAGIGRTDLVLGLDRTGRMDTEAFTNSINRIPAGSAAEIYYHPGAERDSLDWESLKRRVNERGILLQSVREMNRPSAS